MSALSSHDKRSIQSVLINRPLQREFTLIMLGIMMTAAFAVGMVINYTLSGLIESAPSTISKTTLERMIFDANSQLIVSSILVIFVAVIATGFFGVFFLHRVAGPVHRFKKVLERMGSGEIPNEVQLRRRDFFKETAEELNRVIQLLKEFDNMSQKIDNILNQLPKEKLPQDLSSKINEIRATLTQLRKVPE